ncbi:MAG TPA: GNAT family N-acetyltransferase, partial [Gemmatimonadaceae bacterium]|nr:GNAT family N-acetyltransferase [Gemmatimonadaceae bacterium]
SAESTEPNSERTHSIFVGSPSLGTPAARAALAAWAAEEAKRSRLKLLELRTREGDAEAAAGGSLGVSERKVTVLLDMAGTPELLFKQFPSKLRSQIRRPQKEGMELRVGAEQVGAFYEVFARNMRDLGTPVLPRAMFERIARVFGERALFAVVYHEGVPVAGGCGFVWADEFEITWASSLREHNAKSPNMLLYWGLMEHLVGRGARVFNFGRCTPGGPTHKFKLQWGGRDVPLPWLQWSPNTVSATPNPDAGAFGLAVRAWQRLPMPVANAVGPFLARQIP